MVEIAELISRALASNDPSNVAQAVTDYRSRFDTLHYTLQTG